VYLVGSLDEWLRVSHLAAYSGATRDGSSWAFWLAARRDGWLAALDVWIDSCSTDVLVDWEPAPCLGCD
jgi:hypothetical protein